ncbi:type II toxin-antitoxin system RelE/ParE family toxin [Phaeodactylibacter xiamenensis]|uniref:type II toxin-antitoxin system RelE/ParE family toxin n=1 Tax=Phaeodactylibacter xiamenensis TaxID=1524460 RepID=UPI003CCC3520
MAQYKVVITAQALNQLYLIVNYIQKQGSNQNANIVYNGLIETIESLKIIPKRNPVYRTVEKKQYEYRYQSKWSFKSVLGLLSSSRKLTIFWLDEARKPEFSLS